MNIPSRLRKIEAKLNTKQRNKHIIWPILGGLSNPSLSHEQTRSATLKESEILISKGDSVPICIALNREKEFLDYLKSE